MTKRTLPGGLQPARQRVSVASTAEDGANRLNAVLSDRGEASRFLDPETCQPRSTNHPGRALLRAMPVRQRKPVHPLQTYCLDRGVDSLEEAAAHLGVSTRTLHDWFAFRRHPTELRAEAIAEDLGCDPAALFPALPSDVPLDLSSEELDEDE